MGQRTRQPAMSVGDLMQIANRHQLQFPPQLALLLKVLAMLESAAVLVDPNFVFFEALEPRLRRS